MCSSNFMEKSHLAYSAREVACGGRESLGAEKPGRGFLARFCQAAEVPALWAMGRTGERLRVDTSLTGPEMARGR